MWILIKISEPDLQMDTSVFYLYYYKLLTILSHANTNISKNSTTLNKQLSNSIFYLKYWTNDNILLTLRIIILATSWKASIKAQYTTKLSKL